MTTWSILCIGLLLGMKHASEADHLAAVATLVARERSLKRTARLGLAWGLGHTLTLVLFGGVVLALGSAVSPKLDRALEFGVGCMLVLLGVDVIRRIRGQRIHLHVHRHDGGPVHVHAHSHAGEGAHRLSLHQHTHPNNSRGPRGPRGPGAPNRRISTWRRIMPAQSAPSAPVRAAEHLPDGERGLPWRALAVGMMHGMAGSAALILLSLETVHSWLLGLLYIAVFGIGSIAGMALLSVVIAVPLRLSAAYLQAANRGLGVVLGGASCVLGCFMIYRTAS
jgi:hypothetical protein